MKLSELGEFGLIARIARQAGATGSPVISGIGDDCAVVETVAPDRALLLTTDTLTEGVHFLKRTSPPRLLGRKALAVNLSDIAAMGGTPVVFTVNFTAPSGLSVEWAEAFYAGIMERANADGVALVGGDTSSSSGGISVSVALLGECPKAEIVYRRGARPGDGIFLTGWPGESAAGYAILGAGEEEPPAAPAARAPALEKMVMRHLDPDPRLAAGRHIAAGGIASAMIDVSDGVAADLAHILERSHVGALLDAGALPLSDPLREAAAHLGLDPATLALTGGEDYELLFTAQDTLDVAQLSRALSLEVTRIGEITGPGAALEIRDADGAPLTLPNSGYQHFRA